MEKTEKTYNIEADFDWDDVGGWLSVATYLPADAQGNRTRIPASRFDASGNVIFSTTDQHIRAARSERSDRGANRRMPFYIAHKDSADDIKKLVALVPPTLH